MLAFAGGFQQGLVVQLRGAGQRAQVISGRAVLERAHGFIDVATKRIHGRKVEDSTEEDDAVELVGGDFVRCDFSGKLTHVTFLSL